MLPVIIINFINTIIISIRPLNNLEVVAIFLIISILSKTTSLHGFESPPQIHCTFSMLADLLTSLYLKSTVFFPDPPLVIFHHHNLQRLFLSIGLFSSIHLPEPASNLILSTVSLNRFKPSQSVFVWSVSGNLVVNYVPSYIH